MKATKKTEPKTWGGKRPGSGRKSREEMGLPPVKTTTVQVEAYVIDHCRRLHGSLANALRFAAMTAPKKAKKRQI